MCQRDKADSERKQWKTPLLDIRYITRVYFLMFGQVIVAYEGFPTFVTLVAFVIMMDSEVEPIEKTSLNGVIINYFNNALINHCTHSPASRPTDRSCHDESFGHRYYTGEVSHHYGSSSALLVLSYNQKNMVMQVEGDHVA